MRILIIGPFGPGLLAESYACALEANDHEVVRFDSDELYFNAAWYASHRALRRLFRARLWDRLNLCTVEMVRCVRPAFVLAFKTAYLHPETIARIRTKENTPIANYYPDNPYCGVPLDPRKTSAQRRDLVDALREYNHVFIHEQNLVHRLICDKVNATYLPFGVDADAYAPAHPVAEHCSECNKRHQVIFIGQHTARREREINAIEHHEVALWGRRWPRAQRRFNGRHVIHRNVAVASGCAAKYVAADVSLNILNAENIPGHNMRTFEIPASGGVMLATYTAAQAAFFPEGEAAWYYRDANEIDDILAGLLSDKAKLERTRRTALKIAQDHDYRSRAKELVQYLFS